MIDQAAPLIDLVVFVILLLAAASVSAGRISLGWLGMTLWFVIDHLPQLLTHHG